MLIFSVRSFSFLRQTYDWFAATCAYAISEALLVMNFSNMHFLGFVLSIMSECRARFMRMLRRHAWRMRRATCASAFGLQRKCFFRVRCRHSAYTPSAMLQRKCQRSNGVKSLLVLAISCTPDHSGVVVRCCHNFCSIVVGPLNSHIHNAYQITL